MTNHEKLLEAAKEAASKLFSDTTVPQEVTLCSMQDLAGHVAMMIEAVSNDIAEKEGE